jgi:hypothetical protein
MLTRLRSSFSFGLGGGGSAKLHPTALPRMSFRAFRKSGPSVGLEFRMNAEVVPPSA